MKALFALFAALVTAGAMSNTHALGEVLYTKYLYLFETAGMAESQSTVKFWV